MKRDFKRQNNSFSKFCKRKGLDTPILKNSFLDTPMLPFLRKVFSGYTHFECTWNISKQSPNNNNKKKKNTFLSLICRLRRRKKEEEGQLIKLLFLFFLPRQKSVDQAAVAYRGDNDKRCGDSAAGKRKAHLRIWLSSQSFRSCLVMLVTGIM